MVLLMMSLDTRSGGREIQRACETAQADQHAVGIRACSGWSIGLARSVCNQFIGLQGISKPYAQNAFSHAEFASQAKP